MPSPFPGMDPYLELSRFRPDFHARVITYACDALNERLPEAYVARIEEQFRLVELPEGREKRVRPDVAVTGDRPVDRGAFRPGRDVALATLEPVTLAVPALFEEVRDTWVEIWRPDDRRLVTVIEVLSPSNKVEPGSFEYDAKRRAASQAQVNLVEIDMLLGGRRLPVDGQLPRGDYYAVVARGPSLPACDVYAWTVRNPLPTLPIPLRDPDPDVPLDLAAVVAQAYDRGRYGRTIDYATPLGLPLHGDDRAWAEGRAREARSDERREIR